jgi:methylenetetrahydrofolate dehydrogenase (NADP+)/methenyltetrahydrofolate cyclohydrolase
MTIAAPQSVRIDGDALVVRMTRRLGTEVAQAVAKTGHVPRLAVVLVGEDPASQVFVRAKHRATVTVGMQSFEHRLQPDRSETSLLKLISDLNADPAVSGILVQLPLPSHLDTTVAIEAIDPAKDVVGFHLINAGRLATGQDALVPCTPLDCLMLLQDQLGDLSSLHAVVVGRSNIVGKPMAQLSFGANCTVALAHSRSRHLPAICRSADSLVAAVGRPQIIRGDWISRVPKGDGTRLVGDVAFDETAHAAAITPVPGGVGPMTIACLLKNTLTAFRRQHGVMA